MYHPIDVYVGNQIRLKRKSLSLTRLDLSERVGLRLQEIEKYETGANKVSIGILYKISNVLDTPLSYFFDNCPKSNSITISGSLKDPSLIRTAKILFNS